MKPLTAKLAEKAREGRKETQKICAAFSREVTMLSVRRGFLRELRA